MRRILLSALCLVSIGMLGATHKAKLCQGFLKKNSMYIPANLFADSGLNQAQWTALFDKYESIYAPIIASQGGKLQLNRNWDDGEVNANADQPGDGTWVVNMYGGLARYPGMTVDGMALVVCHETGHHLGGAPKMGGDPTEWASNEGEADYFAVLKCAHHMFANDDNAQIVSQLTVDPQVQSACAAQFQATNDQLICVRTAAAALDITHVLNSLSGDTTFTAIATPDATIVTETDDEHPEAQCRLDTYFQGALCNADVATFQNNDYHVGACTAPSSKIGLRPNCWFKPDAKDEAAVISHLVRNTL